jgi:hypothetical protein
MDLPAILTQIAETASGDDLIFPTTTEMALRVQRTLDDPDCSLDQLARLVQADPLLAARVVAVANSVIYNRSGRAIDRRQERGLAHRLQYAAGAGRRGRGAADGRHGAHREHRALAVRLWEHTAHVAALCQVIARRVTHVNPDTAFFAGIIHEVGGFYLIARAPDYPGLLDAGHGSLLAWDEGGAAEVGRAVLRRLGARRGERCGRVPVGGLPDDAAAIVGRHPAAGRSVGAGGVAALPACRHRVRRYGSENRRRVR